MPAGRAWAQWVQEMKQLKAQNISPFLSPTAVLGACHPTWFEQEVETRMLEPRLASLNMDHDKSALDAQGLVLGMKQGCSV